MFAFLTAFQNSVGRKILTGVTGIALTLFLIVHLSANLTLFFVDPNAADNAFNRYSLLLHNLGPLLIIIELGLAAIFFIHAYLGIAIWWRKRKARPDKYTMEKTKGEPSKQTFSSRTMILTGMVLLIFMFAHLRTFKFGPGWNSEPDYITTIDNNVEMRNLSKLVFEVFQEPFYVVGYVAVMLLLGFHLRHGVWSALQSLGAMNKKLTPFIYSAASIIGILIALGFLILPIWIYFTQG